MLVSLLKRQALREAYLLGMFRTRSITDLRVIFNNTNEKKTDHMSRMPRAAVNGLEGQRWAGARETECGSLSTPCALDTLWFFPSPTSPQHCERRTGRQKKFFNARFNR